MDDIDRAQAGAEMFLDAALANARRAMHPTAAETGVCLNCGEVLESGRFCDADCRDDYERREALRCRR